MKIKTVSIIGLGALGTLFGHHLSNSMPRENLRIIADQNRIKKYEQEHVFCNGQRCQFNFINPEEAVKPADLVLFTVKNKDLSAAILDCQNQIGENTLILSALNGITSEKILSDAFGVERVLCCVAQGMDAVKERNQLSYVNMGLLCIGDQEPGIISKKVKDVAAFFEKMEFPYEIADDMHKRIWGKFMLNVGLNQTIAVYEGNYSIVQKSGLARDCMIAAMREVIAVSKEEDINLAEEDLSYWLKVVEKLNPEGKPSMRQDTEAKRLTEVDSFAGMVIKLGEKHRVNTPVNKELYDKIKFIENQY